MTAVVQGEYLQATVESVCGRALVVADKLTFNVEKK